MSPSISIYEGKKRSKLPKKISGNLLRMVKMMRSESQCSTELGCSAFFTSLFLFLNWWPKKRFECADMLAGDGTVLLYSQ